MPNTLSNIKENPAGIIAKAAAQMLSDNLQFTKNISKADASDFKGKNGYSAGDTIYINKPARFAPQSTFDITSTQQDIVEEKVPLPLDIISTVGMNIDSFEFATEIELASVMERAVKPAASAIAQDVEQKMLLKAVRNTYNYVGAAGATVFDLQTMGEARTRINKYLCPMDKERYALLESGAMSSAVNARSGLFNSSSEIAKQYVEGTMAVADSFAYLENQLLPVQANGTQLLTGITLSANMVNGASTIAVTGLTGTNTITAGTVFTIAGVNAVHPITKANLGFLQQFVVTQTTAAVAGAIAALPISPVVYGSAGGSLQNVSALATSGAALVFGTATTALTAANATNQQNLVFHKNAFRMVSVPLVMPKAVEVAAQETVDGITVAIIRAFDPLKRAMVTRLDFLGGLAVERPEWACRISS